ncbi:hypothetical protein MKW92_000696, partial [Papaver armeniacum]
MGYLVVTYFVLFKCRRSYTRMHTSLVALPCPATLSLGVKIIIVAAGGRHSLTVRCGVVAIGGERQQGLESRILSVSFPHLIPCIEPYGKGVSSIAPRGSIRSGIPNYEVLDAYITRLP